MRVCHPAAADPPPIPTGHEDAAFGRMLAVRGLTLRGGAAADREYADLICEQLDDGVDPADVLDDVMVGTGLDGESALYAVSAAVLCHRPEHFDTVLPPGLARGR